MSFFRNFALAAIAAIALGAPAASAAPLAGAPSVITAEAPDGVTLVQSRSYRQKYRRYYGRSGPVIVDAPTTYVETDRGRVWVDAPFTGVRVHPRGVWVRAPFVNLYVPR